LILGFFILTFYPSATLPQHHPLPLVPFSFSFYRTMFSSPLFQRPTMKNFPAIPFFQPPPRVIQGGQTLANKLVWSPRLLRNPHPFSPNMVSSACFSGAVKQVSFPHFYVLNSFGFFRPMGDSIIFLFSVFPFCLVFFLLILSPLAPSRTYSLFEAFSVFCALFFSFFTLIALFPHPWVLSPFPFVSSSSPLFGPAFHSPSLHFISFGTPLLFLSLRVALFVVKVTLSFPMELRSKGTPPPPCLTVVLHPCGKCISHCAVYFLFLLCRDPERASSLLSIYVINLRVFLKNHFCTFLSFHPPDLPREHPAIYLPSIVCTTPTPITFDSLPQTEGSSACLYVFFGGIPPDFPHGILSLFCSLCQGLFKNWSP